MLDWLDFEHVITPHGDSSDNTFSHRGTEFFTQQVLIRLLLLC